MKERASLLTASLVAWTVVAGAALFSAHVRALHRSPTTPGTSSSSRSTD